MEMTDVVRKLIGPINPIGDTPVDEERSDNLRVMMLLIESLLGDIDDVSDFRTSPEHSVGKAGREAAAFLADIGERFS